MIRQIVLIAGFIVVTVGLFGCASPRLMSAWPRHEVQINGTYTGFGDALAYFDEKDKISVHLFNDSEFLYVCLITRNREIEERMVESGLVAWFDADGKRDKKFGIRFPIGLRAMGMTLPRAKKSMESFWKDQMDIQDEINKAGDIDIPFDKQLVVLENLQDRLRIVGSAYERNKGDGGARHPRKDTRGNGPLPPTNGDLPEKVLELDYAGARAAGIEAKIGRQNNYFVYGLKVPLKKSAHHPYAIDIQRGIPIGFGLEFSEPGFPPGRDSGEMSPDDEGRMRQPDGGGSQKNGVSIVWGVIDLSGV
ncbi:MAG TPA: hypothetical protein PLO85_00685 [Candidatus Omnitrophota bacterium]|nr:hypothetical protein [Candidatus Omnitrophota bacterium]